MKINSKTRISAIINEKKQAIETIASINSHFTKLRNPILRKLLASRVTVEDAARIGNCSVELLLGKLEAIGFELEIADTTTSDATPIKWPQEIEEAIRKGCVVELDVRESISKGVDPFVLITEKLSAIPSGNVLLVINSFEPVPLIKIVEKRGSLTAVEVREGVVYTYITRSANARTGKGSIPFLKSATPEELQNDADLFVGRIKEIDVREMEMPLPMVTILEELSLLPANWALYVHHKKVPQYLLPELEERLFAVRFYVVGENDVKLLIWKLNGGDSK